MRFYKLKLRETTLFLTIQWEKCFDWSFRLCSCLSGWWRDPYEQSACSERSEVRVMGRVSASRALQPEALRSVSRLIAWWWLAGSSSVEGSLCVCPLSVWLASPPAGIPSVARCCLHWWAEGWEIDCPGLLDGWQGPGSSLASSPVGWRAAKHLPPGVFMCRRPRRWFEDYCENIQI